MVPVDIRVIAAMNRDLAAAVYAGGFRADLYYRIAGLRITVPPLRDRLADLAPRATTSSAPMRTISTGTAHGIARSHETPCVSQVAGQRARGLLKCVRCA